MVQDILKNRLFKERKNREEKRSRFLIMHARKSVRDAE
ncbi:hypothetical protein HMPREF9124_0571 [Oribacterium sp. oral taxon 108 str. F0425]|nr:hypothetical protein HMPREF9124_0571 [Oribacterium sp. oral taxon 108 str. F0425]